MTRTGILYISDGPDTVDTDHLRALSDALLKASAQVALAEGNVLHAAAVVPIEQLASSSLFGTVSPFDRGSEILQQLAALHTGPSSFAAVLDSLTTLTQALLRSQAIYEENEATVRNSFTGGLLTQAGLSLTSLSGWTVGLGLAILQLPDALFGTVTGGVSVQRAIRGLALGLDPAPMAGFFGGQGWQTSPVSRSAARLLAELGLADYTVNPQTTELGQSRFDIAPPTFEEQLRRGRLDPDSVLHGAALLGVPLLAGSTAALLPRERQTIGNNPAGMAQFARRLDELNKRSQQLQGQVTEVEKVISPDGEERYVVLIPGTSAGPLADSTNPANHISNMQMMAGITSDAERSVIAAMEAAGIPAGAPVTFIGHSQGGLVASRLASDPQIQNQYHLDFVLTFGSPTGLAQLPEELPSLHLEEVDDVVPALDGSANTASKNHVTVTFADEGLMQSLISQTHGMEVYARGLEDIVASSDPKVLAITEKLRHATGFAEGASVEATQYLAQGQHGGKAVTDREIFTKLGIGVARELAEDMGILPSTIEVPRFPVGPPGGFEKPRRMILAPGEYEIPRLPITPPWEDFLPPWWRPFPLLPSPRIPDPLIPIPTQPLL